MRRLLAVAGLAITFAGCAEPATKPTIDEVRFTGPVFAKPGAGLPPNQYGTVTFGSSPAPVGASDYVHGECAVTVVIYYNNGGNDLVLTTDNPTRSNPMCGGVPRTFSVATPDGTFSGMRLNVRNLGGVADGASETRLFGVKIGNSICDRIQWPNGVVTRNGNAFTVNGTGASCLNSKSQIVTTYPTLSAGFTVVQRAAP